MSTGEGGAPPFSEAPLLPTSAPVSSLLPPIPSNHAATSLLQHHLQVSIQAQLAALLAGGGAPAPLLGVPPPPPTNPILVAAASTSTAAAAMPPNPLLSVGDMHGWSVEQIEKHIELLRQLKQTIPQKLTLLLHDAKKRADKRHAKRIANRQSACTSRARKKALVEEMTALNARLRRQALILSLLPDLVIVIDTEGKITFCSAQVERVLQHSIDDLVGAQLTEIIDPGSRDRLSALIQGLLVSSSSSSSSRNEPSATLETTSGKPGEMEEDEEEEEGPEDTKKSAATRSDTPNNNKKKKKSKLKDHHAPPRLEDDSDYPTSGTASANVVTETSFPLSVVQVDPGLQATDGENDLHSDASHSKQPSSLTANSVAGNSGSDDNGQSAHGKKSSTLLGGNTKTLSKEDTSISQSSDSSNTSSNTVSSDAKNLLNANANLERNVRYHNKKIMKDQRGSYKDDVLGAAVTANNASARLSSLQHLRSADSSEEDSGYRESNDSREETSSSSDGETRSQRNGRRKPIAPTCNVCLIRQDLSTIWCEVTSSLRTKDTDDESSDPPAAGTKKPQHSGMEESSSAIGSDDLEPMVPVAAVPQVKEILLCLRPIRDGDGKTDEANRFLPAAKKKKDCRIVSEDNRSSEATTASPVLDDAMHPLREDSKKRAAPPLDEVAQSLVSMSSHTKKAKL